MGTFTLTPTAGITHDAFFIPNAIGCNTDLTPFGEANNWECVDDPVAIPDEDTTYVHNDATNLKYDLYHLPNHTTESGTINYIQIYGRTKSHGIAQHEDGIFKLILTENNCTNIYKSDDIDLVTSYNTYSNTWAENPRTSTAWTWTDVDNLQIGEECNSPTITGAAQTLVIRPNAAGDVADFTVSGCAINWQCVDEAVQDGDTSNVYTLNNGYDIYNFENHTTETGTITGITVYAMLRKDFAGGYSEARFAIKTGGTAYFKPSTPFSITTSWENYSETWSNNPNTSMAWTWTDIDALQAGVRFSPYFIGLHALRCTQVYVIVNYNEPSYNPDIRTTQVYAKVNYTTDPISCTLDKPEKISVDHDQNIKMLNFWSGRRAVYGLSRNKRTMVMTGKLYSETACDTIECIEELGLAGTDIYVNGLGSNNFDKVIKIASFGRKKISEKPLAFEYILECEFSE